MLEGEWMRGGGGVRGVRGGSEDEGSEGRGVLEGVERC